MVEQVPTSPRRRRETGRSTETPGASTRPSMATAAEHETLEALGTRDALRDGPLVGKRTPDAGVDRSAHARAELASIVATRGLSEEQRDQLSEAFEVGLGMVLGLDTQSKRLKRFKLVDSLQAIPIGGQRKQTAFEPELRKAAAAEEGEKNILEVFLELCQVAVDVLVRMRPVNEEEGNRPAYFVATKSGKLVFQHPDWEEVPPDAVRDTDAQGSDVSAIVMPAKGVASEIMGAFRATSFKENPVALAALRIPFAVFVMRPAKIPAYAKEQRQKVAAQELAA